MYTSIIIFGAYLAALLGLGSVFSVLMGKKEEQVSYDQRVASILTRFVCGYTMLGVLTFYLGAFSLLDKGIGFGVAAIGLAFFLYTVARYRRFYSFQFSKEEVYSVIGDAVVIGIGAFFICESFLNPVRDGDAMFSWDTWTRQWGSRNTMVDYSFGLYSQLVPTANSILYRAVDYENDILSSMHFLVRTIFPLLATVGLLFLRRLPGFFISGFANLLLGSTAILVFLRFYEVEVYFNNGRTEIIIVAFVFACLYQLINMSRSSDNKKLGLTMLAVSLLGLSFVKQTGLAWSLVLAAGSGIFLDQEDWKGLRHFRIRLKPRLKRSLIVIIPTTVLFASFYLQQKPVLNEKGFTFPSNHSGWHSPTGGHNISKDIRGALAQMIGTEDINRTVFVHFMFSIFNPVESPNNKPVPLTSRVYALGFLAVWLCSLGYIWGWVLFMGALLSIASWWYMVSYATYNLLPTLAVVFAVNLTLIAGLVRWLQRKSKTWITPVLTILSCAVAIECLPRLARHFSNLDTNYIPISHSGHENLEKFFPEYADGIAFLRGLYGEDWKQGTWRDLKVSADAIGCRLIPRTFPSHYLDTPTTSSAGDILGYPWVIEQYKQGKFSRIEKTKFEPSIQVGKAWVWPARGFYKDAELTDGLYKATLNPSGESIVTLLLEVTLDNCQSKIDDKAVEQLVSQQAVPTKAYRGRLEIDNCSTAYYFEIMIPDALNRDRLTPIMSKEKLTFVPKNVRYIQIPYTQTNLAIR